MEISQAVWDLRERAWVPATAAGMGEAPRGSGYHCPCGRYCCELSGRLVDELRGNGTEATAPLLSGATTKNSDRRD